MSNVARRVAPPGSDVRNYGSRGLGVLHDSSAGDDRPMTGVSFVVPVHNGAAHLADTLASIARVFKTTVVSLQSWNRIPGTQIRAGQRLTVYTARAN